MNGFRNFYRKLKATLGAPWNAYRKKAPLASFITGRILTMLVLLFLLGFALFGLMELAPGDIVDQMMTQQLFSSTEGNAGKGGKGGGAGMGGAGIGSGGNGTGGSSSQNKNFSTEQMNLLREELGLDKPFYVQYFKWLNRVIIHHDLGTSLISKAPVSFLIKSRLWNSVLLNLIELVFITIFSFLLGVFFSSKAGTNIDIGATFFALFFHAFPGILLLILFQLFASISGAFPVTAYPDFSFSDAPVKFTFSYLHHIFLPLFASFLGGVGGTMRMIRATMLDQMGMPYIFALRARGISEKRVYLNHAFRNTLNPYITGSANLLAGLFSGSLVLEIIFAYPGIGRLMYEAVLQEDINLVLANSMFMSSLVLIGMVVSDILLAIVDPRIRYSANS